MSWHGIRENLAVLGDARIAAYPGAAPKASFALLGIGAIVRSRRLSVPAGSKV